MSALSAFRYPLLVVVSLSLAACKDTELETGKRENRQSSARDVIDEVRAVPDKVRVRARADGMTKELFDEHVKSMSREELKALVFSSEFQEWLRGLRPEDLIELLTSDSVNSHNALRNSLCKMIVELRSEDIMENDEWIIQLRGREDLWFFKSSLVKHSERFAAEQIAKTLELGDLAGDRAIGFYINDRLSASAEEMVKPEYIASLMEYMAVLPDSTVRDHLYSLGYVSTLGERELLAMRDQFLHTDLKHTSQTDGQYALRLMDIGKQDEAHAFLNDLIESQQFNRVAPFARMLVLKSDQAPEHVYAWVSTLPEGVENRQIVVDAAYTEVVIKDRAAAERILSEEINEERKRQLKSILDQKR